MNRKDEWKNEEDILLMETTLNHIKIGKAQLLAFAAVGVQLNRTAAACGFRWNSNLRHKCYDKIIEAKSIKLKNKFKKLKPVYEVTLDEIIDCLLKLKEDFVNTEIQKHVLTQRIQDVSLEIDSRRSEATLDSTQNKEALSLLLSKAAELGLFDQSKKPAI